MNKERDKLLEELFGKATHFDIDESKHVLKDNSEALKEIIKINEKNLNDLSDITDTKVINKINDEVSKDFNLASFKKELVNDYQITQEEREVILSNDESFKIFEKINKELKDIIIGQDEAINKLVIAFRRPYLSGANLNAIRSNIILSGHLGSGRHLLIKEIANLLNKYNLISTNNYIKFDLSRYQSQSQETLFLQDLYVALNDPKAIIVLENSHLAHPVFIRMISELSINGDLVLSKRYVLNKNQLVSAGDGLNKGVIDKLDGNNKILVFITSDKPSKLSDIYGKSFMDNINDIIILDKFNSEDVYQISEKLLKELKDKCLNQPEINIVYDETLIKYIANLYNENDGVYSMRKVINKLYEEIVDIALNHNIKNIELKANKNIEINYDKQSIEFDLEDENRKERLEIQKELDDIVGLDKVKEYLLSLEDHIKVSKIRAQKGLKSAEVSKHMIFTGNPGTGKTTIARLISRMMKVSGILRQGHLVEVTRGDLVAKYVGQTAPLVMDVIKSALGGVLFIDEAYSLYRGKDDSFGLEAIDTLVKAMEDYRDDFIVILAGYSKEMSTFLEANSGLKSRFANIIHFEDYSADELVLIAKSIAASKDYKIDDGAISPLKLYFSKIQSKNDPTSGNGRLARNMVEEAILNQAKRILNDSSSDIDILLKEDFVYGEENEIKD